MSKKCQRLQWAGLSRRAVGGDGPSHRYRPFVAGDTGTRPPLTLFVIILTPVFFLASAGRFVFVVIVIVIFVVLVFAVTPQFLLTLFFF